MKFVVTVLGRRVLEVAIEPETASGPVLEATSGGQFEIGFSPPRSGEVTCHRGRTL